VIISVDFDGTVVDDSFPEVGTDLPLAVESLHEIVDKGHNIILFTMRGTTAKSLSGNSVLEDAVNWYRERRLPLFGINRNPQQFAWTNSPKPHSDIFIDDRCACIPLIQKRWMKAPGIDWETVMKSIRRHPKW